eukprot:2202600-Pleurochrysis_carterae.AAC.2
MSTRSSVSVRRSTPSKMLDATDVASASNGRGMSDGSSKTCTVELAVGASEKAALCAACSVVHKSSICLTEQSPLSWRHAALLQAALHCGTIEPFLAWP